MQVLGYEFGYEFIGDAVHWLSKELRARSCEQRAVWTTNLVLHNRSILMNARNQRFLKYRVLRHCYFKFGEVTSE